MAFRIHESVVRGEVDNREKGIVRGQVWLEGRAEPLVLELKGNAWPDIAGCLLTFRNPQKPVHDASLEALAPLQQGGIGDLTASRKVRVFDVPLEEALLMYTRMEKPPEHTANSLYLEWFSDANGRVVIESVDFELHVSPPEWRMTPEEEAERAQQAAAGMANFMKRFTDAVEQQRRGQKDPDETWDEHDYEKFLKECDARTDKYMELADKYGDSEEGDAKIDKEMGWDDELTEEEEAEEEGQRIEETNAAFDFSLNEPESQPDPHLEGIDWVRNDRGRICHPLQHRCAECAHKFWRLTQDLGKEEGRDADLEQFLSELQTTGAKLAAALNGIARGDPPANAALTVAYLKRALHHLHRSQAGLEAAAPKGLLPDAALAEARQDLFDLREGILRLMDQLRGRG